MSNPSIRHLVRAQTPVVLQILQLWGDFPDHTPDNAISQDWLHLLMDGVTDASEQCRFDESDPLVINKLRDALARIIATCELWDHQLTSGD